MSLARLSSSHKEANAPARREPPLPDGAPIAFFDMDNTVLTCNSAGRYARFLFRRGEVGLREVFLTARWLIEYKLAIIEHESVTRRVIQTVQGQPEANLVETCLEWFDVDIRRFISPDAEAAIRSHRERGHHVVLLTAATNYIAGPVSHHLGLDAFISTTLEVDAGTLTGAPVEPLCYGAGKIHWARAWAEAHGSDLSTATFYTDSFTDLPMLEAVGKPVAVNPDPRLKRHARRYDIPIRRWT